MANTLIQWLRRQLPLTAAAGVSLLVWLLYQAGVGGPWFLDDFPNLQPLLLEREAGFWALLDQFLINGSGPLGRPISMLTFIASAIVSADDLSGWKQFNLILHIFTGWALIWLACVLLQDMAGWPARKAQCAAVIVGALWLLHPLQVSTVLYTVQRMAQLSALFCAVGLCLYLSGRRRMVMGRVGWPLVLVAFFICWPLAIFSKENGALFGVYVVLLEALLPPLRLIQQRRRLYALLALLVVLPGVAALLFLALEPGWFLNGYRARDFSFTERLLTETRVVWAYVAWVLLPLPQWLGFMHDDVLVSTSLWQPPVTLLAVIGWMVCMPCLWLLRKRSPVFVAGLGLFLASQMLESTIIPLELVYEHRLYFGSFGILLSAAVALNAALSSGAMRTFLAGVALSVLAGLCLLRVQNWSDVDSLYLAMWKAHPSSPRLVTTFAGQFARNGQYEEALAALDQAREPRVHVARLYIYCLRDGRLEDRLLEKNVPEPGRRMPDYYFRALTAVGALGLEGQCEFRPAAYAALLARSMASSHVSGPERQRLLMYQAQFSHRAGDVDAAIEALDKGPLKRPESQLR